MKKFVTLLTTCLLVVMCTANVFAANNPDVGYGTFRDSTTDYRVSICTNGKATDGVVEITYDSAVLSCEESDVVISDSVDLYSVNVADGVVKISYLSEKPIEEGASGYVQFAYVVFHVADEYVNKDVSVKKVELAANDANGKAVTTGLIVYDEPTPDTEASTENQGSTGSTESAGSTNQGTTSSEASTEAAASETTTEAATEAATEATTEATEVVEKVPVEVKVDPTSEESWKEVVEKLETITETEELVVSFEAEAEATVSKDFLEALMSKEVTVVLDLGNGISWSINGATITDAAADINFSVTLDAGDIPEEKITEVASDKAIVKISLAHDGEFGCEADMKLPAGKEHDGKYANLYYYNPETGELEFVCAELVDEEGYVVLKFNHASDYVVVFDEVSQADVENVVEQDSNVVDQPVSQPEESSSNMGMIIGIVALLAVVVVAVVVVMKKKAN